MKINTWVLLAACLAPALAGRAAERDVPFQGGSAFYLLSASAEHQAPPVESVYLEITGLERVPGQDRGFADERGPARISVWWQFTAAMRDGRRYGVRILSDRAALTSPLGIGEIQRYIYHDLDGNVLDYREAATGRPLLPPVDFRKAFLPNPSYDAVYEGGFASAGSFLGHVLVRQPPLKPPQPVLFDNPILLRLRSDLLIGTQHAVRMDDEAPPGGLPGQAGAGGLGSRLRPYTRLDYERMIAAGANYFELAEGADWVMSRPVFFRGQPRFPDTFYRSNWIPGRMFIDEPSVRMGWRGGLPRNPTGPEQVAEAMRQRVASHYTLRERVLKPSNDAALGTLDLRAPPPPSWETDYWSAWYQLSAGAPALVHEGRYSVRGHGWQPEELYGQEGLDRLTFTDQLNCLNAFLRGAARAFGGDWGVSVYPEGEPDLRLPALIHAYNMGARYIWFWTHYPEMSFSVQERLARDLGRHIVWNPRPASGADREGRVGIAFPAGHAFSWWGTWGMEREQRSAGGASYGDISAAGMWEGILCSRKGIPFDFLVNEPHIHEMGYEQLVIVGADASLEVYPPWAEPRAARPIALAVEPGPLPLVHSRVGGDPDYVVPRASGIVIDGDLSDWAGANWIQLTSETHGFPDVVDVEVTVWNDTSHPEWRLGTTSWMGMTYEQIDEALQRQYVLEGFHGRGVIVRQVESDSPAAQAGIQEGDVIVGVGDWRIDWHFQMHQRLQPYEDQPGIAIPLKLRRSGRFDFGYPGDLAADVALAIDDQYLYLAARVTDDIHFQPHHGWDQWRGDSIQIGLDPTLERREFGYAEEDHEIALILKDDRSYAWRYHGRRGQPLGEIRRARVQIVRHETQTHYEAAIPLSELAPLAPDLWPMCGFNVVVNDSDGGLQRKGRLELRPGAMTAGKRTLQFAALRFQPSPVRSKVSSALLWRKRAAEENRGFRVVVSTRSPEARDAELTARLQSLDSPGTPAMWSRIRLPVWFEAQERSLSISTASPPGRYELELTVRDPAGRLSSHDRLPVYIYPPAR